MGAIFLYACICYHTHNIKRVTKELRFLTQSHLQHLQFFFKVYQDFQGIFERLFLLDNPKGMNTQHGVSSGNLGGQQYSTIVAFIKVQLCVLILIS